MHRQLLLIVTVMTVLVASAVVWGMPFNKSWHEAATGVAGTNRAGQGGIYGSGGRKDKGIKCSNCHIKGPGLISMTIATTPAFTKASNGDDQYTPGTTYAFTVTLVGEHNKPGATMNNKNGMVLAIENSVGMRAGRYQTDSGQDSNTCAINNPYPGGAGTPNPPGKTTFVYGDCHAVLPLDFQGLTAWKFNWVAPIAGSGDLKIFVGMVDGDTDGNSSLMDDTAERASPLREGP